MPGTDITNQSLQSFLLCVCSAAQSCPILRDPMDCRPPGSSVHAWNFPGKNTGVGYHFLLQGIFLTQESNRHLWPWQVDSLPVRHLESLSKAFEFPHRVSGSCGSSTIWLLLPSYVSTVLYS